jgi:hypothetical protein
MVDTCLVTGDARDSQFLILANQPVIFDPLGLPVHSSAGGMVVRTRVETTADAGGAVSVAVVPGAYNLQTLRDGQVALVPCTVPDQATASLGDCIAAASVPPTPDLIQQAFDARDDAAASAAAAGAIAADFGDLGAAMGYIAAAQAASEAAAADALASETAASSARDAALLSRGVFASTAAGLSNGVASVTVTAAGSGGTDGSFALAFSGGGGTGAAGTFTVSGGAVVSVTITNPGTAYTSAPTLSFAASSGLTGATATAAIAARSPVGTYFSVPVSGNDSLILYRVDAGPAATEVARYPATALVGAVQAFTVEPFPLSDWDAPVSLENAASPASGLTATLQDYTVASAGRFYAVPTIASLGLVVGDTVRVAFRRTAGSGQPLDLTFRAGTTLVSTHAFVHLGGWWVVEAVIPATTTIIRIDWTNSTGAPATITRPQFARRLTQRVLPYDVRQQVRNFVADGATDLANLWPAGATFASLGGAGLVGDIVTNADGSITLPADINVSIRSPASSYIRANGSVVTALVKLSSMLVSGAVQVRFVGATSGTQIAALRPVGDGWYLLQGHVIASGDAVGAGRIYLEVDNRTPAAALGYTVGSITVERIYVMDGAQVPIRRPAAAADTFPDGEMVINQSSGLIQIAQRAGEPGAYAQWDLIRYNNSGTRAKGWRINGLRTATRASATAFTPGTALVDTGETELAIREVGKSDFMGGQTHGDMEETRDLQLFVDGNKVTPDGATTYRGGRIEAIQKAELWEVDQASRILTATLVTRWMWAQGELRLAHRLTWARSILVETCYMSMLSALRAVAQTAFRSPDYDAFDMLASGHAMPKTNAARMITTGPAGIKIDMEVVRGWTISARSFAEDTASPARNKLYFGPFEIGGSTSVTAGDAIEWETVYRIGVSA